MSAAGIRRNLNKRRNESNKKVKSLDPYRRHDNTDNPKVPKKLDMDETKASFNNREDDHQIDSNAGVRKSL